jgi:hypothetical protein
VLILIPVGLTERYKGAVRVMFLSAIWGDDISIFEALWGVVWCTGVACISVQLLYDVLSRQVSGTVGVHGLQPPSGPYVFQTRFQITGKIAAMENQPPSPYPLADESALLRGALTFIGDRSSDGDDLPPLFVDIDASN